MKLERNNEGGTPMQQLLYVALILACPLSMVFMMRGMGGGSHNKSDTIVDAPAVDARVAELEREVSRLRGERSDTAPVTRTRR